jgi:hypothetical protein
MRTPSIYLITFFSLCCWQFRAVADSLACYGRADTKVLDPSDSRVVRGNGVFQRGHKNYPFATFSVAEQDSTDPIRICFRYEIENDTLADSASKYSTDQLIQSFRWKDVGLDFVDLNSTGRFEWFKSDFTAYDNLEVSASNVAAFENSSATTTAILAVEATMPNNAPDKPNNPRPIRSYRITEHFPTTTSKLADAHLPTTPVIPVSHEEATSIRPWLPKSTLET